MNQNRVSHNYIIWPNKKRWPTPRSGQQQQVTASVNKDLLPDSPKAAQGRFLCDAVLPEVGGLAALKLLASDEGSAR